MRLLLSMVTHFGQPLIPLIVSSNGAIVSCPAGTEYIKSMMGVGVDGNPGFGTHEINKAMNMSNVKRRVTIFIFFSCEIRSWNIEVVNLLARVF